MAQLETKFGFNREYVHKFPDPLEAKKKTEVGWRAPNPAVQQNRSDVCLASAHYEGKIVDRQNAEYKLHFDHIRNGFPLHEARIINAALGGTVTAANVDDGEEKAKASPV